MFPIPLPPEEKLSKDLETETNATRNITDANGNPA